jgi:4-amino-4-deoxy-L-arabinose transferase-like glycosyltransferase
MELAITSDEQGASSGIVWPRRLWVELLIVLVALLIMGLPNLVNPFGSDQGEYAHIGSEMLAGKVIYRDIFNVKPPMTHWLHALALELFGRSMLAIRLLDWLWQAGTGVALALTTALFFQRRFASLLAGVLYGVFFYSVDFWHSAHTEGFLNLFVVLGVLCFLIGLRRSHAGWWLISGAMVALAVLAKYPIGLMLPFMGVVLLLDRGWSRAGWKEAIWLCLGFAVPLLLFAIIAGLRGGLGPFLDIQFGYIPRYNAGFAEDKSYLAYTAERFRFFWEIRPAIRLFALVWLAEVLLSGLVAPWPRYQWLLPLWAVAGFLHVALQNQYYDGHMHTMLPPLAIMIAHLFLNLDALAQKYLSRQGLSLARPALFVIAASVPLLLAFLPASPYKQRDLGAKVGDFWSVASGAQTLEEHYISGEYGVYGWGFSARTLIEVGDYLKGHTDPDEPVLVWAFEPAIYFLSERESASRFIFNFPLYGDFAWLNYREEFLADFEAEQPAYVLVASNDAMPWVSGTEQDSQAAFDRFAALRTLVERDYRLADQLANFAIYERRDN